MNTLTDRQQETLARGLVAFDDATRRRRRRTRAARAAVAVLLVCAVGALMHRSVTPSGTGLPAYVEFVRDDRQLAAELELANACERFSRTDGRLVVVECTVP